jgi:hypothetical protein
MEARRGARVAPCERASRSPPSTSTRSDAGDEAGQDEQAPLVGEPEEDAVDRGQAEPEDEARPEAQSRGQKPAGKRRHEDPGRECAREQTDRALRQTERGRVAGQERRQDREERGVDQDHGPDEELESAHRVILPAVDARGRRR